MNGALRVADYLGHMLEAIARIQRYTDGLDLEAFKRSEQLQDSVLRNLEVLGEAANQVKRVDPSFVSANDSVPWAVMVAMRNRLSHAYFAVDLQIVWTTGMRDLPDMQVELAWLQAAYPGG